MDDEHEFAARRGGDPLVAIDHLERHIPPWRAKIAQLYAQAQQQLSAAQRDRCHHECEELELRIVDWRDELDARLDEADKPVWARALDLRAKLDSLEAALRACRSALTQPADPPPPPPRPAPKPLRTGRRPRRSGPKTP